MNPGALPSFGVGKHPAAMGQRGQDCKPSAVGWPAPCVPERLLA